MREKYPFYMLITSKLEWIIMTNQQLWQAIIGDLEVSLSKMTFGTWFKNTGIIEKNDDYIVVGVPSNFTRDWISSKYHTNLLKALKSIAPEVKVIKYYVGHFKNADSTSQTKADSDKKSATNAISEEENLKVKDNNQKTSPNSSNLNNQYTFDTFVVCQNN